MHGSEKLFKVKRFDDKWEICLSLVWIRNNELWLRETDYSPRAKARSKRESVARQSDCRSTAG
jgi:hypothetical protein